MSGTVTTPTPSPTFETPIKCGVFLSPVFSPAGAIVYQGATTYNTLAEAQQACLAEKSCVGVIYKGFINGNHVFRTQYESAALAPGGQYTDSTGGAGLPVTYKLDNGKAARRVDCKMTKYDLSTCSPVCGPGTIRDYEIGTPAANGGTRCPSTECTRGACPDITDSTFMDAKNVAAGSPGAYPPPAPGGAITYGNYTPITNGQPATSFTYISTTPVRKTLAEAQQDCQANPSCTGVIALNTGGNTTFVQQVPSGTTGAQTQTLPSSPPQAVGYPILFPLANGPASRRFDCTVTGYSLAPCTQYCGPNGVQPATFQVTQQPANGGRACPAPSIACPKPACPDVSSNPNLRDASAVPAGSPGAYPSSTPGTYSPNSFRPTLPIPVISTTPITDLASAQAQCASNPSCTGIVQVTSNPATYVLASTAPGTATLTGGAPIAPGFNPVYTPYARPNPVVQGTYTQGIGTFFDKLAPGTAYNTLAEAQQACLRTPGCVGVTADTDGKFYLGTGTAKVAPSTSTPAGYPIAYTLGNRTAAEVVNCAVGPATDSTCNWCGKEMQYTYYVPTQLPKNGGTACPAPVQKGTCTNIDCPTWINKDTQQVTATTTGIGPGSCSYRWLQDRAGATISNTSLYPTLEQSLRECSRDAACEGVRYLGTNGFSLRAKNNGIWTTTAVNSGTGIFEATNSPGCKWREWSYGPVSASPCTSMPGSPAGCGPAQITYTLPVITPGINTPAAIAPAPTSCQQPKCPAAPPGGTTDATGGLKDANGTPVTTPIIVTDGATRYEVRMFKKETPADGIYEYTFMFIPNPDYSGPRTFQINATVSNKPEITANPSARSYIPGAKSFAISSDTQITTPLKFKFVLQGDYNLKFDITFPSGATRTFTLTVNMASNIRAGVVCGPNQVYSQTTNSCISIQVPPKPPNTLGDLTGDDVNCPPGQGANCPIIYRVPPGSPGATTGQINGSGPTTTYSTQNPCVNPQQYNFTTHQCIKTKDFCCKYGSPLNQAMGDDANRDPRCKDKLTITQTTTDLCNNPTSAQAKQCCNPRQKANPQCKDYWKTGYAWKKGQEPQNCADTTAVEQAFTNYTGNSGLASIQQSFTLFNQPLIQAKRQFNLKSFFKV